MRRSVVAIAVALLSLLAACEDEPGPVTRPTPTSPSVESSSTEPTTDEPTADPMTPVETVRAWVAARNDALRTGDISGAFIYARSDCWQCEELLTPIEETYRRGGHYSGGQWRIDADRVARRRGDTAIVTAGITVSSGTTVSSRGAQPSSYGEDKFILEFHLDAAHGPWALTTVIFLS